jgi:hypothetical protein
MNLPEVTKLPTQDEKRGSVWIHSPAANTDNLHSDASSFCKRMLYDKSRVKHCNLTIAWLPWDKDSAISPKAT